MKEKREKQLPPPTKKRTGGRIFFLRVISRVERDPRRPKIRGADRGRDLAVISATVYGDAGDAVGFRICATHGRTKSHRNRWYLNVSLRATNTALVALGIPDCACLASVLFALNILFFALQCFAVASFTAPSLFFRVRSLPEGFSSCFIFNFCFRVQICDAATLLFTLIGSVRVVILQEETRFQTNKKSDIFRFF